METQQVKLSILVCTIPGREDKLRQLEEVLRSQLPSENNVELIIKKELHAKNGGPTVGENRNALLQDASGEYVCFVDDDDMVPSYYVKLILAAIEARKPDVVGIKGLYYCGSDKPATFIHSVKYDDWFAKDGIYYRCPNHLNPVKRELAIKAGFTEKNFGEDRDYSLALCDVLKSMPNATEAFVDEVLYYYYK